MKRKLAICLSILTFCAFASGCGTDVELNSKSERLDDEASTIYVVSEYATDATHGGSESHSQVYSLLIDIIAEFQLAHKDIKIELTMLPLDEAERAATLQKMRTEIMAGKGPDVFLSPVGKVRSGAPEVDETGLHYTAVDPLFIDVERSMRNHMFLDLSSYYDTDSELKTEELKKEIMDAGVYDGKRYVLPLSWNMPIVAVDRTAVKEMGIDEAVFSQSVYDIFDAALAARDQNTLYAAQALPSAQICLIPQIFDYESGSVAMTEDSLQEYFSRAASLNVDSNFAPGERYATSVISAIYGMPPALDGTRAFVFGDLTDAPDLLGQAVLSGADQIILPLRATDGSSIAEVTYFGAINANTACPEESYEFLRTFLLPEVQHQGKYGSSQLSLKEDECSWPVRTVGSVASKWGSTYSWVNTFARTEEEEKAAEEPKKLLQSQAFEDSDLPMLFDPVDKVRFATGVSFDFTDITDENIAERVEKILTLAKYYIAES